MKRKTALQFLQQKSAGKEHLFYIFLREELCILKKMSPPRLRIRFPLKLSSDPDKKKSRWILIPTFFLRLTMVLIGKNIYIRRKTNLSCSCCRSKKNGFNKSKYRFHTTCAYLYPSQEVFFLHLDIAQNIRLQKIPLRI